MKKHFVALLGLFTVLHHSFSQMITGVWQGRIDKKKVELKIIQNGDSLFGTSYYYESPGNYRRYSIKGYFDVNTNEVVWWDDELIEEKSSKLSLSKPGSVSYITAADFNCPGSDKMFLDGDASSKNKKQTTEGNVHLEKNNKTAFPDEWDYIIENYTVGANDRDMIDSVAALASVPPAVPEERTNETMKVNAPPLTKAEPVNISNPQRQEPKQLPVKNIQEDFRIRKKIVETEIPLVGDSIELRFYDNAEIDGDSISLFLNDKLIFQHIRLAASAYVIKLPVQELNETNELVMVAENLGEIPPNTSYMVALVGDKRYEANLASTEHSSAMIRLVKPKNETNSKPGTEPAEHN